jgi:transcription initiation factor IIF auxiliary subunit
MVIQQSQKYVADNWWNWSVWIDGTSDEIASITSVEWRLHPSFANPVRRVTDKATNFRLDTAGWGTFLIHASVQLQGGPTTKLQHYLQLSRPDARQKP